MISAFIAKGIKRLKRVFVLPVIRQYYRHHFAWSCRYYGIQLLLGNNVIFHHSVRVWGVGGRIVIKDNVSFAFDGGAHWLGPIGIDMRSAESELHIHENCVIMRAVQFACFKKITVGAHTTIGNGSVLFDSDFHNLTPGAWDKPAIHKPIHLGERVRICPEVTILKGVSVGNDTVIGNKSVVQRSLPQRCVAAGNPARVFLVHPSPAFIQTDINDGR